MFPPVAVFLLLVPPTATMVSTHTFDYEDPHTGERLACAFCPPGTYVSSPCTHTLDTECQPCPSQYFTEVWNFLPKCLHCSHICEGNRQVKEECSATHNRVCECKDGYYSQDGFCIPHTQCPPRWGTKTVGTLERNTQCEKCLQGTFSSATSHSTRCINHTDCGTLHVLIQGTTWHDNICSSCAELTNTASGGFNILRDVLQGFFSLRNVKLRNLKRFVQLVTGKNHKRWLRSVPTRALLLHHVSQWTQTTPTCQLKALPGMLRKSGLHSTARKVQTMLTRTEEKVSMCQDIM